MKSRGTPSPINSYIQNYTEHLQTFDYFKDNDLSICNSILVLKILGLIL